MEARLLLSSELVADLRTDTLGTTVQGFATLGGANYFFAKPQGDPFGLTALWRTDGTLAGTARVTNVASDPSTGAPDRVRAALGRLFFLNYDPQTGAELWVSDGTAAGTHLLKDVDSRPRDGNNVYSGGADDLTEFGGRLFFAARTESGEDLWVTDGTAEGTVKFIDLRPSADDEVGGLAASNGLLFFSARDSEGMGLWRTDGTAGGTVKLLAGAGYSTEFTDVGGTTFFVSVTAGANPEPGGLWKTDGTPAGTSLVRTFPRGLYSPYFWPHDLENVGGRLMFAAVTESVYPAPPVWGLWTSDGTVEGTHVVMDRAPGTQGGLFPTHITSFGAGAVFFGYDAPAGTELWGTDGTPEGTVRLADIMPGGSQGVNQVSGIRRVGDRVFFVGREGLAGAEWWTSDGTEAGTRQVVDLLPGAGSGLNAADALPVSAGVTADGRIIFAGRDSADDLEPWITDGTAAGTFRLADVNVAPVGSTFRSQTIELPNGTLLFNADGKLYATRGDAANTVRLADVEFAGDNPLDGRGPSFATLNDIAVFATPEGLVYRSDGTPAGTYPLDAVAAVSFPTTGPAPFAASGNWIYFVGASAAGQELWRTDGTRAGTVMVRDGAPGTESLFSGDETPALGAAGGVVYFLGNRDQLWRSDGTEGGTRMVVDLGAWDGVTPYDPFEIGNFTDVGGRLFFQFARASDDTGRTLWTSDGTAQGTAPVDKRVFVNGPMTAFGGAVYFGGFETKGVGYSLFRSDGTPAGTVALAKTGDEIVSSFAVLGDRLYAGGRAAVWKTDGTPGGTVELALTTPPSGRAQIGSLTAWEGSVYFAADDGVHGRELWRTDGDRIVLAEDVMPGAEGSDPTFIARAGDRLVFAAADPVNGRELRRLGVEVYVRGSAWSEAFRAHLRDVGRSDGVLGYRIDDKVAGEILPWVNLDELVLRYPAAVAGAGVPAPESFGLRGLRSDYSIRSVVPLDEKTFVLRLDRTLGTLPAGGGSGDRIRVTVPETAFGGTFSATLEVLPGDVDRSATVVARDFSDVKRRFFKSTANPGAGDTGYTVFHDVDGSGSIVANDFSEVKKRFFNSLPGAAPGVQGFIASSSITRDLLHGRAVG